MANVAQSSESSKACAGQAPSQQASSSVIGLGGTGVPLPAPGCANGTPNTILSIAGLLTTICNAENTTEAKAPAGVREALTAIILPAAGNALAKTVVASSESHAVAPRAPSTGPGGHRPHGGTPPGGQNQHVKGAHRRNCPDSDHDCGQGPPGTGHCNTDTLDSDGDCVAPNGSSETGIVSNASTAQPVSLATTTTKAASTLPFTGQDVLKVLLVGLLLVGGGIALGLRTKRT